MNEVQHGAQVEVAYTLRANGPEGEELETCQEESPFVFRMGAEEALEAFEKALVGKRVGEPFELTIACDDAYGEETDEAVLSLPKETFMVDGKLDEEVMVDVLSKEMVREVVKVQDLVINAILELRKENKELKRKIALEKECKVCEQDLEKLDLDKDGIVTWTEFLTVISNHLLKSNMLMLMVI